MKTIETIDYILPEYWASYLINGDHSGLSDDDITHIDEFLLHEGLSWAVDCKDVGFCHNCDDSSVLGNIMAQYTFQVK